MIPRICYSQNITDKACVPCSVDQLKALMQSERVQQICDEIKLLDGRDSEELSRLKRQLPIITPHAQYFQDDRRAASGAAPSGLVMLDVDHVEDPRGAFQCMEDKFKENKIYLAAITPSGHGLRIIAERRHADIAQDQQRLAELLGFPEYDSCTKDLSRASFVMPMSYVLYFREEGFSFGTAEEAQSMAEHFAASEAPMGGQPPCAVVPQEGAPAGAAPDSLSSAECYRGVAYSTIISQLVSLLGGTPEPGERNTFYFTLVRYVRYICDFNSQLLLQVLPDFGLSQQERLSVISSAVNRPRRAEIPDIISRALTLAEAEAAGSSSEEDGGQGLEELGAVRLPRVLDIICSHLPVAFRPAMVIASLPVLGALATRVRFRYLDHAEHSFSFMSCITAPAATGKSFIRTPINLLLTPIDEQDEIERQREQDYKDALRAAKNSKVQPENPRACPRNNGINVSVAKLLQLLSYSEGKHLIGIGEEIDTLVKSERAGSWSQKSDIYRLGFDNAKYGQNYMSDNSFSANVPVYYNLLLTGTPGGMYRFFKDVEDGLVTRFCFAQLPDMFGSEMPDFQPYTDEEREEVIRYARLLDTAEGTLSCPAVDEAIRGWLEEKRQAAIAADSRAIDTLRRRSAVIGFRAGYLAHLLYEAEAPKRKKKASAKNRKAEQGEAEFARCVADYVFRNQMDLFGQQFEKVADDYAASRSAKGKVRRLLQSLPDTFTRAQLMALRARNGQSTGVAYVITRWKQNGLIEEIAPNTYKKR